MSKDILHRQVRMRHRRNSRPAEVHRVMPVLRGQDPHQEGHQPGLVLPHGGRMGAGGHVQGDADPDTRNPRGGAGGEAQGDQEPLPQVRSGTGVPGRMQRLQVLRMDQVRLSPGNPIINPLPIPLPRPGRQ